MSAIDFHDNISLSFDKKYTSKKNFIQRNKIWIKYLDKYLPNTQYMIDVGCGTGIFSFYAQEKGVKKIFSFDAAKGMIAFCLERQKLSSNSSIEFALENLPMTKELINNLGHTDLIICSSVLEYIDDVDICLKQFKELLSDNGKIILSLPNRKSFYRVLERNLFKTFGIPKYFKYVRNSLSLEEFSEICKKNDLDIIASDYFADKNFLSFVLSFFFDKSRTSNLFISTLEKSETTNSKS